MKKTLLLTLNMILLAFLTGCSAYAPFVQFEQRIMIQLVGIDLLDDVYTLSVQFSLGSSSDGSKTENDLKTVTGQGPNLLSAAKDARANVGKEFFFSHNQVLFLGEGVIKGNAVKAIEEYLVYCDYYSTAFVAGVYGKAEDLLSLTFKDEYSEKNKMLLIIEDAIHNTVSPAYKIHETLMAAKSESSSFFIPMLRKVEGESGGDSGGGSGSNGQSGGDSGGSGEEKGDRQSRIFPDGGAVVIDGKLAEYIDRDKCEGLSLLAGSGDIASIDFAAGDSSYSLEMFNMKTAIYPEYTDENLKVYVDFKAVMYKANNHILTDLEHNRNGRDNKELIRLFKDAVKAKMTTAANYTTSLSGDLFRMEDSFKHRDYTSWLRVQDNWRKILKNAEFVYRIKVEII